ncbi:MAG: phage minor head protein [Gelidibacter sp.]
MYSCTCDDCNHVPESLGLAINPRFKKLLKTVETAFKKLYDNKGYKPEDLAETPEYQDLIFETNSVISRVFKDNDLSPKMLKSLEEDVFYFSSLKSHAQLFEASRLLMTDKKVIKSFTQFSNDAKQVKANYNENYLEAEYDFAVGSVQMAERYDKFSDSDRYLLQYRTANDERVRASHQLLHDITLPKADVFWDKYFPPNGWRCRCTTVEVLARDNEVSDSKIANDLGDTATTEIGKNNKNKLQIFRFNAGKQKVVFPPEHPYSKVAGANEAVKKPKRK